MNKLILLIFAAMPTMLLSQSIERQVIGSTGGSGSTASLQVSYTVGETVTATGTSSNIIITQGFQQPTVEFVGIDILDLGLSVEVYPNPASNFLIVDIETKQPLKMEMLVVDILGGRTGVEDRNLYIEGRFKKTLDLSPLPSGNYFLLFQNEDELLGTIKFQKIK